MEEMLDHTVQMPPYRTSMKLDYDDRRPLEVEAIFGNPLRMAKATNLPRVQILYQQLKFLDAKNRASQPAAPNL
jgi:2-dehydropantoate 2-reductase